MASFIKRNQQRIVAGEITVLFYLWKYAHMKPGNSYALGFGYIEVEDVQAMPAALVSDEDVRLAGCRDASQDWQAPGDHSNTLVQPDTLLHRVQFHYVGRRARAGAATERPDAAAIAKRLERMDGLAAEGPWTQATLRLIEAAPHAPARLLAAELELPLLQFKAKVRQLKALGLTESFEVGYELTTLGRGLLAETEAAGRRV